jgi:hypothetical protein
LHKAIFSFVFGDGDPNADWETREKQAVIAYIQANKGVISLPEFMILTGLKPDAASSAITAYCVEFGGSPEATDDGTVVYRFDGLLLRADTRDRSFSGSSPVKRLEPFSANKKSMNIWFCIINGVNTIFGGYFFYNALSTGAIKAVPVSAEHYRLVSEITENAPSYLYGMTYWLAKYITDNPLPIITIGLGLVPLVFSVFFWLIPLARSRSLKKHNNGVQFENLRKIGYSRIWSFPRDMKSTDIVSGGVESAPPNMAKAQDKIIKEIGVYSIPDVGLDGAGVPLYTFPELEREKTALETYRAGVRAAALGSTVFDSDARLLTGTRWRTAAPVTINPFRQILLPAPAPLYGIPQESYGLPLVFQTGGKPSSWRVPHLAPKPPNTAPA